MVHVLCNAYLFGWPEWVHPSAGQAGGGRCLVLGPELEPTPPWAVQRGKEPGAGRPESLERTEAELGKLLSVVNTEGQERAEMGNKVRCQHPGRTGVRDSDEEEV